MSKNSLLESSLTWLRVLKPTRDFMDAPQPLLLLLLLNAAGEQSDPLAVDATDGMETHRNSKSIVPLAGIKAEKHLYGQISHMLA